MPDPTIATPARPVDLDRASVYARHRDHSAAQCENGDRLILRLVAELRDARKSIDLVPEAGGHPAQLITTAAERIRAANHATFSRRPVPGLATGSDAYDVVGALHQLASRLPQLCDQVAAVLTWAAEQGTLTGPEGRADLAAVELRHHAADGFKAASNALEVAWNALSPVGGWLSADAEALAGGEG